MTIETFPNKIFSDGTYYLSIPNAALVNCPIPMLIVMLIFNIASVWKDWLSNKTIFETYRSSITGNLTIDPLNGVPKDQLEKEQCSLDYCPSVVRLLTVL